MLRRLSAYLMLPAMAAFTLGLSGCGGGNFESPGDPYGGIQGSDPEVQDVEADLLRQKEAAAGR